MTRVTTGNNGITQKYSSRHKAIDIGWHSKESDNIVIAHSDGKVIDVVRNYKTTDSTGNSYGNYILIEHQNNYKTRYAHLKYGSVKVSKGDIVRQGQNIAVIGNTGHSTGRHLHFELIKNGVRIDPTEYLTRDLPEQTFLKGTYKLIKSKYLRTSPEVKATNKIKYNNLMFYMKQKCLKDTTGYAKIKIGETVNLIEFKKDSKGNTWGKIETLNTPVWICINDSTGLQVIKL